MRSVTELSKRKKNKAQILKTQFQSGALLLDVRTSMEYTRTSLAGARHIPYDQLLLFVEKIRSWNKPVITYSTYGRRSKIAANILSKSNIRAFDGSKISELKALLFEPGIHLSADRISLQI